MKVMTWNTNGSRIQAIKTRLELERPNVAVIQEAGNLPEYTDLQLAQVFNKVVELQTFADLGYITYWVPWQRTHPNGNIRCSLAILADAKLEMLRVQELVDDNFCPPRPIFWGVYKSYCVVANIHAGGKAYIENAFKHVLGSHPHRHIVIAGDFNQTPEELHAIPHPSAYKSLAVPGGPTRPASNKKIDLAVTTFDSVQSSLPFANYGGSDHVAVVFTCPDATGSRQ